MSSLPGKVMGNWICRLWKSSKFFLDNFEILVKILSFRQFWDFCKVVHLLWAQLKRRGSNFFYIFYDTNSLPDKAEGNMKVDMWFVIKLNILDFPTKNRETYQQGWDQGWLGCVDCHKVLGLHHCTLSHSHVDRFPARGQYDNFSFRFWSQEICSRSAIVRLSKFCSIFDKFSQYITVNS